MKYYIAENGQQAGPFEPNELLLHGLTVNSLVWCEGMPAWTSASQVPELMALLSGTPVNTGNTGGIDVQLPPVPPIGGGTSSVPPTGGQMPLPPLPTPQTPLPQTPTPQGPTGTTTNQPYNLPQTTPTQTNNPQQAAPKTWLLESVLVTVMSSMCCGVPFIGLIPGLVAIYMAWGCKTCYAKGDIDGANKKSASAKKWLFITVVVGVIASLYGGYKTISSNPNIIQDIQNGNVGFFYGID